MPDLKETMAMTVNGKTVTLDQMLLRMKLTGELQQVLETVGRELLVEQSAADLEVAVTDDEVQAALEESYEELEADGQEQAVATLNAWGLTLEDWKEHLRKRLIARKVKDTIASDNVDEYFSEHWEELETADLWEMAVEDASLADELATQLREEEATFEELATKHSVLESRESGGYVGTQTRASLAPELREAIFAAEPGSIVGPLAVGGRYLIVKVDAVNEADLDDETRASLQDKMFNEWLGEQWEASEVSLDLLHPGAA